MVVASCSNGLDSCTNSSTTGRGQLRKHFGSNLPNASRHVLIVSIKRDIRELLVQHKTILRRRHLAIPLLHQIAKIIMSAHRLRRTYRRPHHINCVEIVHILDVLWNRSSIILLLLQSLLKLKVADVFFMFWVLKNIGGVICHYFLDVLSFLPRVI